jgi:hypothetical protein
MKVRRLTPEEIVCDPSAIASAHLGGATADVALSPAKSSILNGR